ncbi:McrB family protein [Pseudomonas citronellolis]|uniref:McrB family protein n=1 Tax=Pseudomonas citronellolis TaxID=53408 RepID=UPI002FD92965
MKMDLKAISIDDFFEAVQYLREADSQNNSKGKLIKDWFSENFGATARASIVNETRQAGNRVKEQLGAQDAQHVVYVVTDPNALEKLINDCRKFLYHGLETILFMEAAKGATGTATPVFLLSNISANSAVEEFYLMHFKNLKGQHFSPSRQGFSFKEAQNDLTHTKSQSLIAEDNEIYVKVLELLDDGYGGVIFTGDPGTSKSWFARQIALKLADGNQDLVRFIQFHPGYQYEDFVESYIPNEKGGFDLVDKIFLRACESARKNPASTSVLVIDELSRTDVVRVFGEALTYLEQSNRELNFTLSSGRPYSVPDNLVVLCTMNPWDRGVEELDLALERRFAKIHFEPKIELLKEALAESKLSDERKRKVEQFFFLTSRHSNRLCSLGHAYFLKAKDDSSLRRLWDHQLSFHFERVLKNDPEQLAQIKSAWNRIFDEE